MKTPLKQSIWTLAVATALCGVAAWASSHREAPLITTSPKLDATDFYMFNSYESGRSNYVTIVANYIPLQDAYGGPNYFTLDPNAVYEIHVDNTGDAVEDLTFQFRFTNDYKGIALPIGSAESMKTNAVPVINVGQISATNTSSLNVIENYTVSLIRGPRRAGTSAPITNAVSGSATFEKPADNIGNKSIPDYEDYARSHIYTVNFPGSDTPGKVFVGQRKDPFVVNLGEIFDLINISTSPLGPADANKDSLYDKNVTALILEVPKSLLASGTNTVVAAWTTASKVVTDSSGKETFVQMSRLGQPLVNEVVIGLKDKDKFNASEPKDDGANFLDYVTHPTLPTIIELLYGSAGVKAPTKFPREDLVTVFLTGIPGVNQLGVGEMLRLNTATPTAAPAAQSPLGVLGGDSAGFPNGRRPGDDVVDIALRAVMGVLLSTNDAPSGKLPFTDGAYIDATFFTDAFPYLRTPLRGSPNDPSIEVILQSAVQVQGPYQSVPATFDAVSQKMVTPKTDSSAAFYRTRSNGRLDFNGLKIQGDAVEIGVK